MREMTSILLRGLCLAAVLTAGSCSSPSGDEKTVFDDPIANHHLDHARLYDVHAFARVALVEDDTAGRKIQRGSGLLGE